MVRLLNERAYQAAFLRWHDAPVSSIADFEAHFQPIQIITATLQPARESAAAGSIYAAIPTHLRIQDNTGQLREENGCVVLSRSNPGTDGADPGDWWQIDSSMSSVLLFSKVEPAARQMIAGTPCWDNTSTP